MLHRAQGFREAACGFSSGISRTLIELAEAIEAEAAEPEAKAAAGAAAKGEGGRR